LEKIICADPSLSVAILRTANGYTREKISTIRSAIMTLGQRSVRNLATSWMIQALLQKNASSHLFDAERYSNHCTVTAQTARYIFARTKMKREMRSTWTLDEVFAAALVHDLGTALLACVAPDTYQRVHTAAERFEISINDAFEQIYNNKLSLLACVAVKSWELPLLFENVIRYVDEPWLSQDEFDGLACINYADYLVSQCGCTVEKWAMQKSLEYEVKLAVEISDEEAAQVVHLVNEKLSKESGDSNMTSEVGARPHPDEEKDILIVDDNKLNQELIAIVLNHFGYAYRIAANGSEAVRAFSEKQPALILMDVSMPGVDGLDATKQVRLMEQCNGRRTPIIALTARALPADEAKCIAAGMDDHITKPLMIESFAEKIAMWLPQKAA
jgi:CheY-like chemotaxis protein